MKRSKITLISFLLVMLILVSACNFPLKFSSFRSTPYATLDPAVFDLHKTPTAPGILEPKPDFAGSIESTPVIHESSIYYTAQSGDTLNTVAKHFNVELGQITSPEALPAIDLINPGQTLVIPLTNENSLFMAPILPDGEVIHSPCASDFDLNEYVSQRGGYLTFLQQKVGNETLSGIEIIQLVADNHSVNPRLLLAFVEFRSGWVFRYDTNPNITHPLGLDIPNYEGFYLELSAAARMINTGYYAWREGGLSEVTFTDLRSQHIPSNLNAGSVGLLYLFSQLYPSCALNDVLYGEGGFIPLYTNMFGDPWECQRIVGPLMPGGLQPPMLELPFAAGETWALTGGLHPDWNQATPIGALDFAPVTGESVCAVSKAWVRASAPGIVSLSSNGLVILDLVDQIGEPTGWEIVYLHVAAQDRVAVGTLLNTGDPIGHPSCEGGASTGTHVHITRKYLGEWIGGNEPLTFILSGYTALTGMPNFQGGLVSGANIITPRQDARQDSIIIR